ncbi:MAG: hypothetical protein WDZ83_00695 [Rhizobiaceae bacterium]
MPKKPNYDFERQQREHAKASKKAEKLAEKAAAREDNRRPADNVETGEAN